MRRAARGAVGLVMIAGIAGGAMPLPTRVTAAPATVASIAREPRIVAIHYHDLRPAGPPEETRVRSGPVMLGAPTRRIKERFLASLPSAVGSPQIRRIAEPRFAYLGRGVEPDPARLQRTFGRGLAFDFYSPWRYLPVAGGVVPAMTVHARLVRLDDLAVLWAETCMFEPGPLRPPPLFSQIPGVEALLSPVALAGADRCGDTLVAAFTGRPTR